MSRRSSRALAWARTSRARWLEVWKQGRLARAGVRRSVARARRHRRCHRGVGRDRGGASNTLLAAIEARISGELTTRTVLLDAQHLTIMSWIYDRGRVKDRTDHEDGFGGDHRRIHRLRQPRPRPAARPWAQAGYGFRRLTSAGRFRGSALSMHRVTGVGPVPCRCDLCAARSACFHAIPNFPKTSGFCSETGSQARRCPGCGYGVFATPDRVFARHASGWIEIFPSYIGIYKYQYMGVVRIHAGIGPRSVCGGIGRGVPMPATRSQETQEMATTAGTNAGMAGGRRS